MKLQYRVLVCLIVFSLPLFCDNGDDLIATGLDGSWRWTNDDSEGTHIYQILTIDGVNIIWTSEFNPESVPGKMWKSWGINGTFSKQNETLSIIHFSFFVDRLYVVTSSGTEQDIVAIPMDDYPAVVVGATLKGTYSLSGDTLSLYINFVDAEGDYPTENELLYDFIRE